MPTGLLCPRERNTEENTPLQLFDELEIHPLVVSVETDTCPDMFPTIYKCIEKIGKPRNYGEQYGISYVHIHNVCIYIYIYTYTHMKYI